MLIKSNVKSNDWLAHITSNRANYYYCYTLFSNY